MRDALIRNALQWIGEGRTEEAFLCLDEAVRHIPRTWKPLDRRDGREIVYCWTAEEFRAYSAHRSGDEKAPLVPIVWMGGSYTHALYLLAWMASEKPDPHGALRFLDQAREVEPDHPDVLCLRGFVLRQLECVEDAVLSYRQALVARAWATSVQKARALRGLGGCLIDLDRWEEAESALEAALTIEPESPVAKSELDYIREMGAK